MRRVKLGIIQMDVQLGAKQTNYAKVTALAKKLRDQKIDILVLPEMWNTGYAWSEITDLAEPHTGPTSAFLRELASDLKCTVVGGSIPLRTEQGIYNTTLVFNPQNNLIGTYAKIHLFELMQEKDYLQPGGEVKVIDVGDWQAGLMICYDLRFPELARRLVDLGAKMLFLPAQFPHPRLEHWKTLIKARAIENQVYVVAVNRVGTEGRTNFFGNSLVVDPWGEVVVAAGAEEEVLTVEIDLDLVAQVREKIPCWSDRRTDLY